MFDVIVAIALPCLLAAAFAVGLVAAFHPLLALALAAMAGGLWAAMLAVVAHMLPLSPLVLGAVFLSAALAASAAFLRTGLGPRWNHRRDDKRGARWSRVGAAAILFAPAVIAAVYLWANALHPPILSGAIFEWSAPARASGAVSGFPLWFSRTVYLFTDSDVAWKFTWALLGLVPWAVTYGGLRALGSTRALAALGTCGLAFSFSALFWGGSGYPELFLAACAMALFVTLRLPGPRFYAALLPAVILAWSGPYWLAFGALVGLCATLDGGRRAITLAWGAGALVALVYWAAVTPVVWERLWPTAAYLFRDAWNPARHGPLLYGIVALALTLGLRGGRMAMTAAALGGLFFLAVFDVASTTGASFDVVLAIEGNRSLTGVLAVAWLVAVTAFASEPNEESAGAASAPTTPPRPATMP